VHALIGPGGGGRDRAVSDRPPVVDRLVVPRGQGDQALQRTADRKVTESRPGSRRDGQDQGIQEAADPWLPTGRTRGSTITPPQGVKIKNTTDRSRQSTAGRPDAVGA
jgi:hypothetical protein